ncbi:DNA internalization-related competence protein ComEC/Rec2 [Lachnospiraceae bacterium 62-35]
MLGEVLALYKADWGLAALCIGAAFLVVDKKGRLDGRAMYQMALLFSVLAGFGRMEMERTWAVHCIGLGLDGEKIWINGTIEEVKEREKGFSFTLSSCQTEGEKLGRIEVFLDETVEERPEIGYEIKVYGEMKVCKAARNPGEFDYQIYALGKHSCYQMYGKRLERGKRKWPIRNHLSHVRRHCGRMLDALMEEEDSGIMKAMLLGEKTSMDGEIRQLYQRNGIAHILAISGLHISLLGAGFYRFLRRAGVGFGRAAAVGGGILWLYSMMTGLSPSSFRAVIMMTVFFIGEYRGRTYDMMSAAGLAAIILLVKSPFLILQSGFQLSFGAVLSIGGLGAFLEHTVQPKTGIGKQALMGMAIQMGTCPIVLYHFYQYPIYGFFLNLAVIPLMAYGIVSGIAGICLGSISLSAGRAALGTSHYILALYRELCQWTEGLPISNVVTGKPDIYQILIYLSVLAGGLWLLERWKEQQRFFLCPLLCLILFLSVQPEMKFWEKNRIRVTFLDVGQGDGILIEIGRSAILFDGGSSDRKNLGEQVLEPCLKSKGIQALDYVIISHCDEDHISGIRFLLQEGKDIKIRHLGLPALGKKEEVQIKLAEAMERGMKKKGEKGVREIKAGDILRVGEMEIHCLYPGERDSASDRNQQSLVLLASCRDMEILLTGDTDQVCERTMTERKEAKAGLAKVKVLKAGHHGSDTSTGEELLSAMEKNLKWAVLSYGKDNKYGHPGKEVLRRLEKRKIQIFHTADQGAIILKSDKDNWTWNRYLEGGFLQE